MSKRRILLIGLPVVGLAVVLLLAAAAVAWFARPKPAVVTLEVTGTPGLPLKGMCDVDGTPKELTGAVPTKFVLEGKRITFTLTTTADKGQYQVKTTVGDQVLEPFGSLNPPKYAVRGWVQTSWGWSSPTHWVEPFVMDEQKDWLKPPP